MAKMNVKAGELMQITSGEYDAWEINAICYVLVDMDLAEVGRQYLDSKGISKKKAERSYDAVDFGDYINWLVNTGKIKLTDCKDYYLGHLGIFVPRLL